MGRVFVPAEKKQPRIPAPKGLPDRRRNKRFLLGLPVKVQLEGYPESITVELVDVSANGGRFRGAAGKASVNQGASVAFLLPGNCRCLAEGRIVRADASGEFALLLGAANAAFVGFVGQLEP